MGTTFEYVDEKRRFVAVVSSRILDGFRKGDVICFYNLARHAESISGEAEGMPRTGNYIIRKRVPQHEQFSDRGPDNRFDMRYVAERLEE